MFNYKFVVRELATPSLEEVKNVLLKKLKSSFVETSVEVVDCPDLSVEPFNLAAKGLGGSPAIVEVGGPAYLLPTLNKEKLYDFKKLVSAIGYDPCFLLGPGAGPWPYLGKNGEMVANLLITKGKVKNKTQLALLQDDVSNKVELQALPDYETRFAALANLFICEGYQSKVLKIHCVSRVGSENFISCMRTALESEYKDNIIGIGGSFLINAGKARQHVIRNSLTYTLNTDEEINKWLKFYEMSAPLVAVGTLLSQDIPELDLRVQHFHSFSNHNEGGHYHEDTTPSEVEYLGYFNLGQKIYRLDQPVIAPKFRI